MMTTPRKKLLFHAVRAAFALSVVSAVLAVPTSAQAATTCGSSSGHTICVTVGSSTLTGHVLVTITNSPNSGPVFSTWAPPGPGVYLMEQDGPSPETGNYSFVWPTEKYRDATGSLQIRAELKTTTPVVLSGLTLSNGNTSDIQHTPNNWQTYLPGAWTQPTDAVILATGDGPDDQPTSNGVANAIAAADPPLFLFLGDIYEKGSFTENLNHYGVSAMDVPGGGTLWGATADATQPTMGNHENANSGDWKDYWHQRPNFTAFTFGGVLFIDLDSNASFAVGSQEYNFVQGLLASAPPCVVAFEHHPIFKNSDNDPNLFPMWPLLANNGGDLLLTGHTHTMSEYIPLDAAGQAGGHMVQLISGGGGHSLGSTQRGPRVAWGQGGTAGMLSLALNGSANGGTATGLTWAFKNTAGNVLRTGSVGCGGGSSGPSVFGFNPTSGSPGTPVDITGSGLTGASNVTFGGVSVEGGGFTVNSDTSISATVPAGAITGPVCVTVGASTGCSSSSFTVGSPGSIARVGQIGAVSNTSGVAQNTLSLTVNNPVPPGDTVVIGAGAQNNVTIVSAADSRGNTYAVNAARQYTNATGGKSTTALISAHLATGLQPGDTITVTLSKGNTWGFVAEQWTGLSASDRNGTADSAGANNTAVSVSTSAATSTTPEAVFAVTMTTGWPGSTAGPGYTQTADMQLVNGSAKRELAFEYAVVSSTGVQTATFALGKTSYWVAAIATYA